MKYGYMFLASKYTEAEEDRKWMLDFGCEEIFADIKEQDKLRPNLGELMNKMRSGDTLVVPRLCNVVRGSRELNFFLGDCRSKHLRIVSIHDKIDSANELFPDTTAADVLEILATLPAMIVDQRGLSDTARKKRKKALHWEETRKRKSDRTQLVVNMYNSGYTLEEILMATGVRSRSTIYSVLNEAGVELNRGNFRGPLGPRKKKISLGSDTDLSDLKQRMAVLLSTPVTSERVADFVKEVLHDYYICLAGIPILPNDVEVSFRLDGCPLPDILGSLSFAQPEDDAMPAVFLDLSSGNVEFRVKLVAGMIDDLPVASPKHFHSFVHAVLLGKAPESVGNVLAQRNAEDEIQECKVSVIKL